MKVFGRIFFCLYSIRLLFSGVLSSPSLGDEDEDDFQPLLVSEMEASKAPPELLLPPDVENGHGPLTPLFKVLSGHSRQALEDDTPRPLPDARALRYMKRLYKMFATKEGIPKTNKNHIYNTVRLFTPHAECKHLPKGQVEGDLHSVDLLFNLDCITSLEHLLKSVLLYSIDKSVSKSLAVMCTGNLIVKEHDAASQVCPNVPHAMAFSLYFELRRKWVEIDVTTFLRPLVASNKRNIHMAMNFTCRKNDPSPGFHQDFFNMVLVSPSLLLYLNDTSEQAYHKRNSLKQKRNSSLGLKLKKIPSTDPNEKPEKDFQQSKRAFRQRRDEGEAKKNTPVPIYDLSQYYEQFLFAQNECELHNFWLRFSQLKWDRWIIAPHKYNPRYCKGECPRVVGHRYGSPVHTMVQNIIYEKLDSSVPRPSCVPAEYSPLSVLKVEPDRSIVYKEYEDMIATKCTCR